MRARALIAAALANHVEDPIKRGRCVGCAQRIVDPLMLDTTVVVSSRWPCDAYHLARALEAHEAALADVWKRYTGYMNQVTGPAQPAKCLHLIMQRLSKIDAALAAASEEGR